MFAIMYLHASGIAHRDVKPPNAFIFKDSYIKLGDFGFVKQFQGRTHTSCGTSPCMAPEIKAGRGYGRFVDWWAFGITVYEMMFGYRPFPNNVNWEHLKGANGIYRSIVSFPPQATEVDRSFLQQLLHGDLSRRLGCMVARDLDIFRHKWFSGIEFEELLHKNIRFDISLDPLRPQTELSEEDKFIEPSGNPKANWFEGF